MSWHNWLERVCRWSVVLLAWSLVAVSLMTKTSFAWSYFHLFTLAALLFFTEFFPFPDYGGRVTAHFPLLFAISFLFSPGMAGLIFIDIVLAVTWLKKHSFSSGAFRTGYTLLGLFAAHKIVYTFGESLLKSEGFWGPFLGITLYVLIYEIVSKTLRDVIDGLRPMTRRSKHWFQNWPVESGLLLLSLLYCGAMLGMLQQKYETDPLAFAFFFTPLVAFAILSNVIARLIRKKRKLELLFLLSTGINKNLDLRKVMEQTLVPLAKVVDYTYGVVYLLRNGRLYPSVTAGVYNERLRKESLPLNRGLSGWVASHGRTAMVPNVRLDPRCHHDAELMEDVRSMLSVPLEMDGEVLGVITLAKAERYGYEDVDLSFLQVLASQTVIALHNARLMQERERRVVAEERNRMAREIHDGIAQSFAGVLMKVESSLRVFDKHPEKVKEWLEESLIKLRDGLKEVRHSITALRPSPAAKIGLIPALGRRVEAFQNETGVDAIFETEGESYPLKPDVDETIYMVCHEALNNAAKHAQADEVRVTLAYEPEEVRLVVQDDGVGFSLGKAVWKAEAQKRYGIVGMNERAQQLGAALQFDSREGEGTKVILTIPIEEEEEAAVHAH
ncbi:hypothetical protein GCM10011571_20160 [Marinithermofilum abyssi]|uniref:histidine kinase n=1 Tax=Marinithermofilum abyssi TaxID=1571185 RepID=A0A8J2Y9A2_9BACL|nr:GAF domain-containing sensor histidine kinase [Marinithermofilum abyssi]GGE18297.1 hypothetical protein GCM10011571_20160 [Marinithermofilum abyssi]